MGLPSSVVLTEQLEGRVLYMLLLTLSSTLLEAQNDFH